MSMNEENREIEKLRNTLAQFFHAMQETGRELRAAYTEVLFEGDYTMAQRETLIKELDKTSEEYFQKVNDSFAAMKERLKKAGIELLNVEPVEPVMVKSIGPGKAQNV